MILFGLLVQIFCILQENIWPRTNINDYSVNLELKSKTVTTVNLVHDNVEDVIPVNKFSNIHRLLSVVVYVLRFKNCLLSSIRNYDMQAGDISVIEIKNTETYLIKREQSLIMNSEKFN